MYQGIRGYATRAFSLLIVLLMQLNAIGLSLNYLASSVNHWMGSRRCITGHKSHWWCIAGRAVNWNQFITLDVAWYNPEEKHIKSMEENILFYTLATFFNKLESLYYENDPPVMLGINFKQHNLKSFTSNKKV